MYIYTKLIFPDYRFGRLLPIFVFFYIVHYSATNTGLNFTTADIDC